MTPRLLSLIAVSLVVLGSSASVACAHGGPRPGWGVHRGAPDWWRDAYDHGYRDGRRDGERDARRAGRYERRYDRWDRRDERRRAYEEGYRDGYRVSLARYSRSGRGGYYPDHRDPYGRPGVGSRSYRGPAFARGYEEGYEEGRGAGEDRDAYDPRREKKYRDGDSGYDDDYGSKDAYRADYRNGFLAGYGAGYRENRRY
jgi:hypothetical protein